MYYDVLHVEFESHIQHANLSSWQNNIAELWFAKNVGMIKYMNSLGYDIELVDHTTVPY